VDAEIVGRVNIYFTSLSSVMIAAALLAQIPEMSQLFKLFVAIAFPVIVMLGIFTVARLIVLGHQDFEFIRAINRVRQFYVQAAPEASRFLLFPPYDDDRSVRIYAGYTTDLRGNLLSASSVVSVTNSIVATVLVCTVIRLYSGASILGILPYGLGILLLILILHGLLSLALVSKDVLHKHRNIHFPAPRPDRSLDDPG
jgi:hypothetical protein